MTRAEKEHHQHVTKKCRACLVFSLSLVTALGIAKMVLSNQASTWGRNFKSVKLETENIKKQNLLLKSQIVKNSGGLTKIAEKALEEGYTDKPNFKYFTSGESVAQILP